MNERIYMDKSRIVERTQGCWNCVHYSNDAAIKLWSSRRQADLEKALQISLASPVGEDDIQVQNIKNMVNKLDHGIAVGHIGTCGGKGETAAGEPVGTFVVHNYLCHKWSAAQGASIARAGQKADELPEELVDKLDRPTTLAELTKKAVE